MCLSPQIVRVQSPEGMKKIPSSKRETAAAFLKKVIGLVLFTWLPVKTEQYKNMNWKDFLSLQEHCKTLFVSVEHVLSQHLNVTQAT